MSVMTGSGDLVPFRGLGIVWKAAVAVLLAGSLLAVSSLAATLEVGPGKPFARIEEANAQARPGDVILVYPRAGGQPYEQTAVFVRQARLTFRARSGRGLAVGQDRRQRLRLQRRGQHAAGDLPVQRGHGRLRAGRLRAVRRPQRQPQRRGRADQPGQPRHRPPLLDPPQRHGHHVQRRRQPGARRQSADRILRDPPQRRLRPIRATTTTCTWAAPA